MIFLLLDIFISYYLAFPTYFFLINLVLISKNNFSKLVIITLVLDLLILNTYFINTLILGIIFFIYKRLKITKITFLNYLISLSIIYILYILGIGLVNNYSVDMLLLYIVKNYIVSFIFYVLCYKIVYKHIKLSR